MTVDVARFARLNEVDLVVLVVYFYYYVYCRLAR